MKSTVVISELEKRIFQLIGKKKNISSNELENYVSVYELFHLMVMRDDFSTIEIYGFNEKEKEFFRDEKYDIEIPSFKIRKKEC